MRLNSLQYVSLPTSSCRPTLKTWISLSFLFFTLSITQAQKQLISGTVISTEDQLPVIGASILEKGTNNITLTNTEGVFKIEISSPNTILVFTYIGMDNIEMPVDGKTSLTLSMTPSNALLNEFVLMYPQPSLL
jgi:TonB-dependent starch-binding outer membrane protein SusC